MKKTILAVFSLLCACAAHGLLAATVSVAVDATKPGRAMPNTSQVLTFWNGVRNGDGTPVGWKADEATQRAYPVREFVRYVELMACTGGNKSRDLFKNPDDRTKLDDYDFEPLVAACRGILALGMKPYMKLGNVPAKFTADYDGGEFAMNIRPPTDDLVHYRYMKACAAALKKAFGRDEVRTWRFAVLTEADNTGWFQAKSKSKDEIREAFFRLYDYAAKAFEEELGSGLVFGTHLLYPGDPNCPQTQFSVEEFAEHCAKGKNAATGKTGAPLRLLTASYYGVPDRDDLSQGRCVNLRRIRAAVDKYGFRDVVTGVDEGRVIVSRAGREKRDLLSRAVGASYQAAFDVRVMKEIFDDGMDYFASWGYFTGPAIHFQGVPSHHYFSSRELARFEGLRRVPATVAGQMPAHEELDAIAGVSEKGDRVRAVVGRFRDKLVFTDPFATTVKFALPKAWAGQSVEFKILTLDDRNNWYCDWERDRAKMGVTAKDYDWSPDDFAVMAYKCLQGEKYKAEFTNRLQPGYAARAARVKPVASTVRVGEDATLAVPVDFVGNGAAYVDLRLTSAKTAKTKVMLFFDTEDFTCDKSSDAIRDLAKILTEEGVVGEFNIVGLLAREIVRNKRQDVIDALKGHAIGTQTYGHSFHPTICEKTDMVDYRVAYRNALRDESIGVGMLEAAFGLDHIDYAVPPGNSWSYASMYAFADMGMTFYGGGGFEDWKDGEGLAPSGNRHWQMWYCNLRQIPYSYSFSFEDIMPFDYIKTPPDIDKLLDKCAGRDGVVWSFHPHMALKKNHWDGPNYKGANLVEWGKWKMVEDWPDEVTQKFYRDFRAFLKRVKADGRFEFSNTFELKKTIKPRVAITKKEIPAIRQALLTRLGPVHEPASWSVADVFQASVVLLRGGKSHLPSKAYGFLSHPQGVTAKATVSAAELKAAAEKIDLAEFIPPVIRVGDQTIGPADFLYAALEVLETGAAKVEIAPREQLGDFKDVPGLKDVDIISGWPIHAKTLNNELLNERLKLQLWTLRFE